MRLVTGLPQFCPVEDLHACSKINALQDVAEQHLQAQRVRLSTTAAGRQILRALGYNTDKLELLSSPAPPWELIDLVEAYTACRAGGADYAVLSAIRTEARRLREEGYTIVIRWIPAHEGITGNEKAHQAARAAALSAPLPGCTLVSASWARDDVAHPSSPPMDRAETWHRAQCYRRRILQHVANPEQLYRRPPRTFRRVEAVLLRRAQTGQLLSPAKLNLINPHSYPTPQCPACPARGTAEHLLWRCPAFDVVRERALQSLGGHRPGTLHEWAVEL
ncbi:uncharacterized protein LOC144119489 [Amblyomma americanum]